MSFQVRIGLELHIQLNTRSKLFSSAPNSFNQKANTSVCPYDLAHLGTLPLLNKMAVIHGIRVANALHMEIENELWFDRKNYFYSDLSKGYQITQEFRPLGKNGFLDVDGKRIKVTRLHLEEDTCKQTHFSDYSLLDYNRSGIPLIEIVSEPCLTSGKQARHFVEKIRSIVTCLNASSGKMQEGALRCDVNISLSENDKLGTKVEIKNLNSFNNIELAVDYEIKRQKELISSGKPVLQETRRFDENKKETVLMRIKSDNIDYRCFVDPNIIPIILTNEFIDSVIQSSNELPEQKLERYIKLGVSNNNANLLISNKDWYQYFDESYELCQNLNALANWIINVGINVNKNDLTLLINNIDNGTLSFNSAKKIYSEHLKNKEDISSLITKNSINNDEQYLTSIINEAINECQDDCKALYRQGKDRVIGYLVGQVMKKSGGKANPALTNQLIVKKLLEDLKV